MIAALALSVALSTYGFVPGERVEDLPVRDTHGQAATVHALKGSKGAVLITYDTECPVSQRYEPRLRELAAAYRDKGFNFALVDVTPHALADARKAAARHPQLRTIFDEKKALATSLRAKSTAEAFVIDASGTLRYRGAIDDQYGIDYQRPAAKNPWLRDAMEAVARGGDVRVTTTEARGCPLALGFKDVKAAQAVTYHERVSRIIQNNCQTCHRVGGLGPMPLENYRQVFDRRAVIELMVGSGRMPPWSAKHGVGEWTNDRSLSERDKRDLLAWIKDGGPEGDPRAAPQPRRFNAGWNIGKPDYVLKIPEPINVPAQGVVEYKYVYAKTNFNEDKWITALEVKPTQPKVVHHVLAFLEEPGRPNGEPASNGLYGFFAATVPGSVGVTFPAGTGKRLPKGAWIKFEIHYQPNGTEVMDQTAIGFRISPVPLREVESRAAHNVDFVIPPNAPRHAVKAAYDFKKAGTLTSLFPHMHLRGSAFRYDLRYPDGKVITLLDVPKYDFSWQSYYELKTPLEVPAGAQLQATAWYDNSKANPWNPDPSKAVRWGHQTWEEMMIAYFDFIESSPPAR